MSSAHPSTESTDASEQRSSLLGRLLAWPGRVFDFARNNRLLTAVLACGTAIILFSGTSALYFLIIHRVHPVQSLTVTAALEQLDAGQYDQAKQTAVALQQAAGTDYRKQGPPLFVQGLVLAHEADEHWSDVERKKLYLVAARYLEEARDRGLPAGREGQALYLLATCLFRSGRYAESLPALHTALDAAPRYRNQLYDLLGTAYFRDTHPQFEQALHFNQLALENPSLRPEDRRRLTLQRARILLAIGNVADCRVELDKIAADTAIHDQVLIVRGRSLMLEADQMSAAAGAEASEVALREQKLREAIATLQRAQSNDATGISTRKSRYLIGQCYQKLGDERAAERAFSRTRRAHYRTPEGFAAGLSEAEIQQRQGRQDTALVTYLDVLQDADDVALFNNPWVSLTALRQRLHSAFDSFLNARQFELAVQLASAFQPVIPADQATAAVAKAQAAWADSLIRDAEQMGVRQGNIVRADARHHYRTAGQVYGRLAQLRFTTRDYPEDLWNSGFSYLRGHNYKMAVKVLRQYLATASQAQRPRGLVALGEAHLSLDDAPTALRVLNECIEFYPKHPDSYRARLLASRACQRLNKIARAESLLNDNLHNEALTPRSRPWQESFFALGLVLYDEAVGQETLSRMHHVDSVDLDARRVGLKDLEQSFDLFQRAIQTLDEAVQRVPNAPESIRARYCIAESWRHSAKLPRKTLPVEPTQTRRNSLRQQMRQYLQNAATAHRELQKQLTEKQEHTDLSDVESTILRNTYFCYADTLFDLGEYDDAIRAYSAATNRYQHEPESLEAFLQIATCYRRLNAPSEARGTLLQALAVLARIRQDADFKRTTRYTRDEWTQMIGWLAQL